MSQIIFFDRNGETNTVGTQDFVCRDQETGENLEYAAPEYFSSMRARYPHAEMDQSVLDYFGVATAGELPEPSEIY